MWGMKRDVYKRQRVHTLQGRSEGNHVLCRVFVKEQSAFQTCRDSFYLGIYNDQTFVDLYKRQIVLSAFDPVRREIARLALHQLVTDGRIHPALSLIHILHW